MICFRTESLGLGRQRRFRFEEFALPFRSISKKKYACIFQLRVWSMCMDIFSAGVFIAREWSLYYSLDCHTKSPRNQIMYCMMLRVCESLQETITTKLHPRRHGRRSCGKLFIPCHQCNLYSRCWLGSSFVPGNLISDEMIEFREGLFAFRTSFFVRTSSFLWMHWLNQPKNCFNEVPHGSSARKPSMKLFGRQWVEQNGFMFL